MISKCTTGCPKVSFPAARTAVGSSLSGFAIGTSVIVETHRSGSTASGLSAAIRAASPQRASVTLIAATVLDGDGTREILFRRMRERQTDPRPLSQVLPPRGWAPLAPASACYALAGW